jgi:hypothetical protein
METTSSGHDGVQSRPLLGVPFQQLRRASLPYDLTWAGRMTVLVLFVIQASGTLVLFGHRLSRGEAGEVDIRNAVVALGGLVVQLQSIGILLLNSSWYHVNEGGLYLAYQEARQGRRLFSICLTFLLMLNSYYFRQHMAFILLTVTTLNIPWEEARTGCHTTAQEARADAPLEFGNSCGRFGFSYCFKAFPNILLLYSSLLLI